MLISLLLLKKGDSQKCPFFNNPFQKCPLWLSIFKNTPFYVQND
ncbi:unnamed protein product [Arabidopsis halleri]